MLWDGPSSHGQLEDGSLNKDNDNDDDNNDGGSSGNNSKDDSNSSESLETATRSRTKETLSLISFFFRHSFNS